MPNYCYSTLNVSGSEEDIKSFKEKFCDKEELSATKVIPYPKELDLLDKMNGNIKLTEEERRELMVMSMSGKYNMEQDGYNQGGYAWCCKHWGSKWGFCSCEMVADDKDNLEFTFSSAWSPLVPLMAEMSRQLPNITLDYSGEEESNEYAFDSTWKGGKEVEYIDRTDELNNEDYA